MGPIDFSTLAATAGLGGILTMMVAAREKMLLWAGKVVAIVIAEMEVSGDANAILRYLCMTSYRFSLGMARQVSFGHWLRHCSCLSSYLI
jgi:hypothetical protein